MGKNGEMLKTFIKVMSNDEIETSKIIPDMYFNSFYDINPYNLLKKDICKLIVDIDGTILPVDDTHVTLKLYEKILDMKLCGLEICLVSNNNEERVIPVAKYLNVKYISNANKPLPEAYDKALKVLNEKDKSRVAMIGDQMLSDIKGANEYGIYSILVNPVSNHNNIKTGTQRVLQRRIENHLKRKKLFDRKVFYK